MNIIETELPGVLIIEPNVFADTRGFFMESWNFKKYEEVGITQHFVQDNFSQSVGGVLRGLHFQNPHAQAKLVSVIEGEVFDVAVDIRVGSPTYAKWVGERLSGENKRQFYIPEGFAHGFAVLSDKAVFQYKCSDFYAPECDGSIMWNDPDIGIDWPIDSPILSDKDTQAPRLAELNPDSLPRYAGI